MRGVHFGIETRLKAAAANASICDCETEEHDEKEHESATESDTKSSLKKKRKKSKSKKKKKRKKSKAAASPTTGQLIKVYMTQKSQSVFQFDRISVTESNEKTVLLSSKGYTKGSHEWSIEILKCDVDLVRAATLWCAMLIVDLLVVHFTNLRVHSRCALCGIIW